MKFLVLGSSHNRRCFYQPQCIIISTPSFNIQIHFWAPFPPKKNYQLGIDAYRDGWLVTTVSSSIQIQIGGNKLGIPGNLNPRLNIGHI